MLKTRQGVIVQQSILTSTDRAQDNRYNGEEYCNLQPGHVDYEIDLSNVEGSAPELDQKQQQAHRAEQRIQADKILQNFQTLLPHRGAAIIP